jgi:hypothetical protein
LTATLLLFDRWLVGVIPTGKRMMWFGLAFFITGCYFALDELLRRQCQRATDWKTGVALGLAGSFITALAVAATGYFLPGVAGTLLVGGAATLFVLLAVSELPATYLFTLTNDWFLSWWVRVSLLNGFLAGLVPLVSETAFKRMMR